MKIEIFRVFRHFFENFFRIIRRKLVFKKEEFIYSRKKLETNYNKLNNGDLTFDIYSKVT